LYSEDQVSAKQRGELPPFTRGQMVPEFEAVAFRLKSGQVSEVFESAYGFHFLELMSRKGEMVNVRHILISPKMTEMDYLKCKVELDSIHKLIEEKKITFEDAARKFSDDKETKGNGGLMVNPATAGTKWSNEDIGQLDQNLVFLFDKMNVGEVTPPMKYQSRDAKAGYRIMTILSRSDPHKANLKDDYAKLLQMASFQRQQKKISEWIAKRSKGTYIKIDPAYSCKFEHKWHISN
jgi:peptidyl-prolyl cis-trans isomerase SurA